MSCLSHWAAISINQKEKKKSGESWIADRDINTLKTLDGSIKSLKCEVSGLIEQKEKLSSEIAGEENELLLIHEKSKKEESIRKKEIADKIESEKEKGTGKNKNSVPVTVNKYAKKSIIFTARETQIMAIKVTIKDLRTKLSDLVVQMQKTKCALEKSKLSEEVNVLKECLLKEECSLNDLEKLEGAFVTIFLRHHTLLRICFNMSLSLITYYVLQFGLHFFLN